MTTPENPGAQSYFDKVPKEWDALYSHEHGFMYRVNKALRKGLYERYAFTFEKCGDLTGASVLDIGCGTARYSIECAKRGARRVTGIDFAPSMIEFSRKIAADMRVADRCEFIHGDFLAHPFAQPFDIVLALGVFDYIKDPAPVFNKIASLKPRVFAASFPRFTFPWSIQRRIRYYLIKKCPIYDYSKEQIEGLCKAAGFDWFEVVRNSHGYLCAAGVRK